MTSYVKILASFASRLDAPRSQGKSGHRACAVMQLHDASCSTKVARLIQVTGVKNSESSRNPGAPFITSSMVQDAANRLGFKVANTMSTAQALFEGGDQGEALGPLHSVPHPFTLFPNPPTKSPPCQESASFLFCCLLFICGSTGEACQDVVLSLLPGSSSPMKSIDRLRSCSLFHLVSQCDLLTEPRSSSL